MGRALIATLTAACLLIALPASAKGYMAVHMGAEASFVYAQAVDVLGGHVILRHDVTSEIAHEVKLGDGEVILVIN